MVGRARPSTPTWPWSARNAWAEAGPAPGANPATGSRGAAFRVASGRGARRRSGALDGIERIACVVGQLIGRMAELRCWRGTRIWSHVNSGRSERLPSRSRSVAAAPRPSAGTALEKRADDEARYPESGMRRQQARRQTYRSALEGTVASAGALDSRRRTTRTLRPDSSGKLPGSDARRFVRNFDRKVPVPEPLQEWSTVANLRRNTARAWRDQVERRWRSGAERNLSAEERRKRDGLRLPAARRRLSAERVAEGARRLSW